MQLLRDVGVATTGRILTDASSAKAIAMRDGVGRLRHVDVRFLWLQDKIRKGYFTLHKVPGAENFADLGTKFLNHDTLVQFAEQMGCKRQGQAKWGNTGEQEGESVELIANIFKGMMAIPAARRHTVLKMLLTAATLSGSKL